AADRQSELDSSLLSAVWNHSRLGSVFHQCRRDLHRHDGLGHLLLSIPLVMAVTRTRMINRGDPAKTVIASVRSVKEAAGIGCVLTGAVRGAILGTAIALVLAALDHVSTFSSGWV